ncbi:MAG: peptidoglycan-binding protein [Chloracidobacterium sp.]|nr:peptidoglycan-binding protein [Chloracidobacterium sp.]MDW8217238.1 peptidoglycan-binding domain-containing protein [Acidobacteriota bacterium]
MLRKHAFFAILVACLLVSFSGMTVAFTQDTPAAEEGSKPKKKPRANNPNTDYGKAQTILKEAGLYKGEITGYKNAETTEALRKYQEQNGLKVTGTLTNETREKMGLPKRKAPAKKKKEEGGQTTPSS